MNFLQQMGFGGIGSFGFSPMGWPGMGMQSLFGNPMGFGFNPFMGGMGMSDPYSMYQMAQQFFAQQPQAGQYAQQGQQPQYAAPTWQAQNTQPTFVPDQSQSPYDQMQALKAFALKNGSRDGTPIADWTDVNTDSGAGNFLTSLGEKQGDLVLHEIRNASPEERELLKAEEEKFRTLVQQREAEGRPMSGGEKVQAQIDYTERLYAQGKLNPRLGEANRQQAEIKKYGDQTFANMFLKHGVQLPADLPKDAVAKSPYNPQNR